MAWVILRIVAEVAFSKAMQVGHPKTTEVYENAEACKVRGQVLAICSLSKTAVTEMTRFLGSSTIQVVCISASFATRLG